MFPVKFAIVVLFLAAAVTSCFSSKTGRYNIADSKSYEASLFRQNCAICHGPEGNGKTLDDGTMVPSLREGEFKFKTDTEIYNHIADGGNGMTPFRGQLTERELRLMVELVQRDLRNAPSSR